MCEYAPLRVLRELIGFPTKVLKCGLGRPAHVYHVSWYSEQRMWSERVGGMR